MATISEKVPVKEEQIGSVQGMLEWLRAEGNLLETDKEVDPDLEITGVQKILDGSLPILFNNVKGKPEARVVTNLFANIEILERFFGWENSTDRTRKLAYALTQPQPPLEI